MAISFGFYDSVGGDRSYNAEDVSRMFSGFFEGGVFRNVDDGLKVIPGVGMQINIGTGRAWFNNTWTDIKESIETYGITGGVASGMERYDAVCVQINNAQEGPGSRTNSFVVVEGTSAPEGTAEWPDLTQQYTTVTDEHGHEKKIATPGIYQYCLAIVHVRGGATSILSTDIMDNRGVLYPEEKIQYNCPWVFIGVNTDTVDALPKTGGSLVGPVEFHGQASTIILGEGTYGVNFPENPVEGQVFFKLPEPVEEEAT